jgi:MFS transporter, SP family, general alpha glucoside:H+ symporter
VFKFATGALGLASVGVIISWFLLYRIGRRTLYVWASAALTVLLLLVGIISTVSTSQSASFAQAGLVMVWEVLFYATIGPVCYTIRIAYYISQIIVGTISPYMINPTEANWKGKVGYFWAGTCFLTFIWVFFCLPETRGE